MIYKLTTPSKLQLLNHDKFIVKYNELDVYGLASLIWKDLY